LKPWRRARGRVALDGYSILKFVHVLLAIVAVGANATYGVWLGRAAREPRATGTILRNVKFLDDYVANPSYIALAVTGLGMVFLYDLPWKLWIVVGLVLWAVALGLGYGVYTPTLRKQIDALDKGGSSSDEFKALGQRGTIVGAILGFLVVAIVFVMVTKPGG
jgi:uncharacterized membrane protein